MKKILLTAEGQIPPRYLAALNQLGAAGIAAEEGMECEAFSGLLLCGGGDPDPMLFGEKNQGSYGISLDRDRMELDYIHRFLEMKKPILGICRGHQLLNIAFGGTLIQHLPTAMNHIAPGKECYHEIQTDGFLKRLYGRRVEVNSSHHQGVARIGRGLKVVAVASDGVVEGMVHEHLPVLGVQFHPERMENGLPVLDSFLKLC